MLKLIKNNRVLYYIILAVVSIYTLHYRNNQYHFCEVTSVKNKLFDSGKVGNQYQKKCLPKPPGYDSILKGTDLNRLGLAVSPKFQVIPKTYNDILEQLKTEMLGNYSKQFRQIKNNSSNVGGGNEYLNPFTSPPPPRPKQIRVLVGSPNEWGHYNDEKYCTKNKNPEYRCNFTDFEQLTALDNSTKIQGVAGDFDAIFLYRDMFNKYETLLYPDTTYEGKNQTVPKIVYFTLESPAPPHDWQMSLRGEGRRDRNILASYWRGSDIYTPYFVWHYYNENVTDKHQERNYAEGRTQMAAIVVSNCLPNNNRLGLVKELRRYIQVDVFGKCGEIDCRVQDCFLQIEKNYKFYLSFENSNCRDYITEKLLKGYENDLLPIVMGAHPADYKAIAPRNSYIHIEDFDSVEMLAKYLQLLDKNDTLYNSYFAWKGTGDITLYGPGFMCELCSYLHVLNIREKEIGSHRNNVVHSDAESAALPYFNREDAYDFKFFNFSDNDTRLCLKTNLWYWTR